MADVAENAAGTAATAEAKTDSGFKMSIKGGIPSSNANEEFIRVDWTRVAKYGQLDRRTGFVPVVLGHSSEFIQAVKDGKIQLKLGAKTRNGNFLVNVIDPEVDNVEISDEAENLVEHSA